MHIIVSRDPVIIGVLENGGRLGLVGAPRLPAGDGQHCQEREQRRRIKEQAARADDIHCSCSY
jgi:hypothetical protein